MVTASKDGPLFFRWCIYCWFCTVTMTSWLFPIGIRMGAGPAVAADADALGRPILGAAALLLPGMLLARPTWRSRELHKGYN